MRRVKVKETETLTSERHLDTSNVYGGAHAAQPMKHTAAPRAPVAENTGGHLSGDVKERLQVKPEQPAKKKPAGTEWVPFVSVDRMGQVKSDDAVGAQRAKLSLNRHDFMPSMDADNTIQHEQVQAALASRGFQNKGVLKERGTDDSNEYLYEEVRDKETGDTGLLYRNNYFDRI